ncbi:fimbrillin family protein [Prevotella copri]|uniref:Fimbrillin family protein n=2 Tax=Segatella copri TaxID=165179 RepID=A0AA90UQ36_9BACT|nr:fimbrillin family protein [Segatella copri]MQN76956.1 fimbrillin family protein [Segatella copri]MQO01317.1 fimbrillin family protein [Segatella copri]
MITTMKTIKYMGMALIMAALASCSSDDDFGTNWQNDPTAVRVSATVGGVFTRSNPVATKETDQMNFNGGDAITISTEGQASVNYILKDGTWGPETSGQFLKWSSELMTFTARYPKGSGDFIVPTNQNGIAEIASADYMTATTVYDKIPDDRKVNFAFDRQMARVVITIAGFNNEFSDKASVSEMYVTSKERIAKDGSAVTATSDIIPYSQSRYGKKGSIYYALVAPNTATNYEFIKLRVKYESDVKSLTVKNPVALEAGKSYNFNLTIGKNGVSLGTVSVEDWGNTGTISGGEASIDLIDLSKGNINITSDGYYVITTNGVTTANTITINSNATVQLKNAVISADGIGIDVKSGSPTIIVSGTENSVTSTTATAINVCDGATLTIKGKNGTIDKLTAKGGSISTTTNESSSTAGAGIGSSDGGNIVIENVSIDATGGTGNQTVTPYYSGGAGIGSSSSAHCGDITISNAVITATGGMGAPGIGMGAGKSASAPRMGNINIKSSTITATGGLRASAIGFPNEYCFDYSKITILTGGTINIETVESSETFLNRLTCDLGTSNTIIIYKIGKGDILWFNYIGLDGGDWPGVVLKASDQEQTSKDGIGALSK